MIDSEDIFQPKVSQEVSLLTIKHNQLLIRFLVCHVTLATEKLATYWLLVNLMEHDDDEEMMRQEAAAPKGADKDKDKEARWSTGWQFGRRCSTRWQFAHENKQTKITA